MSRELIGDQDNWGTTSGQKNNEGDFHDLSRHSAVCHLFCFQFSYGVSNVCVCVCVCVCACACVRARARVCRGGADVCVWSMCVWARARSVCVWSVCACVYVYVYGACVMCVRVVCAQVCGGGWGNATITQWSSSVAYVFIPWYLSGQDLPKTAQDHVRQGKDYKYNLCIKMYNLWPGEGGFMHCRLQWQAWWERCVNRLSSCHVRNKLSKLMNDILNLKYVS